MHALVMEYIEGPAIDDKEKIFADGYDMVEIDVMEKWVGKNLVELKLREKYAINVVAVIKENEVITAIDPLVPLEATMKLIVIANTDKLAKLYK